MKTEKGEVVMPDQAAFITFLKMTKDGKYAKIERSALEYSRLKEQTEETSLEEEYYYGVS